jgi:hypothetical protein
MHTHSSNKLQKFKQMLPACQKADGNCFLGQEMSADGGINAKGTTIMSEAHCKTIKKLHSAIQDNRHGMLTSGIVFLHDIACLHTAALTRAVVEHLNWELFDHPPYSPDLAPSGYHLFTYQKNLVRVTMLQH